MYCATACFDIQNERSLIGFVALLTLLLHNPQTVSVMSPLSKTCFSCPHKNARLLFSDLSTVESVSEKLQYVVWKIIGIVQLMGPKWREKEVISRCPSLDTLNQINQRVLICRWAVLWPSCVGKGGKTMSLKESVIYYTTFKHFFLLGLNLVKSCHVRDLKPIQMII